MNEAQTRRDKIDPQLRDAGWEVTPYDQSKPLSAYHGCAIEEYPTENGPADYALCLDARIVGIVEAKKEGLAVLQYLIQFYRNLYMEERWEHLAKERSKQYGWVPTEDKKRVICSETNNALVERRVSLRSPRLHHQLTKMVRNRQGQYDHLRDEHDDVAIAYCLAYWVSRMERLKTVYLEPIAAEDDPRIRAPLHMRDEARQTAVNDDVDYGAL